MDPDLPDFPEELWDNLTEEDWADGIQEPVNWNTIDQEMFGEEWVREMEALDSMPTAELYYSSSSDGFIPTDWQRSQEAMDDVLSSFGLVGPKLLVQLGDELVLTTQLATHLGLELTQSQIEWHRRNLVERIQLLVAAEPLAKRLRGELMPASAQLLHDIMIVEQRRKDKGTSHNGAEQPETGTDSWMIPGSGKRSRLGKVSVTGVGLAREEVDRRNQTLWSREVILILRKASAPVIILAEETSDPARILLGAVGSSRGSTMETYVKAIRVFITWLGTAYVRAWPGGVIMVVEFLHVAGSKPCSPTFPKRFLAALSWFEKVGGWVAGERSSMHELVARTVAFWTDELRSGVSPLKQAPRLPWCLIAALELFVINLGYSVKLRLKAWSILLKAYGTLREDDLQHICPNKLRTSGELLITELLRSKTTGTAKRIRQLPVALWLGCTVTRTLWIEHGLALVRECGTASNDFVLPSFDLGGKALPEPMCYQESSALTRQVLSQLHIPFYCPDKCTWEEADGFLLCPELVSLWTEHSPRAVIPSSAQVLECPKDDRNYLGRWSPGGSDDYGRAYRVIVQGIQKKVVRAVLSGDLRLREHDVLDRMDQWGENLGLQGERIEALKVKLREAMEGYWKEVAKAGGPGDDDAVVESAPSCIPLPKAELPAAKRGKYLIVYSRNRKHAKLHKVGGCAWTSVTLADSQEIINLSSTMYNSRCKLCWPEMAAGRTGELSDCSSESDF